MRFKILHLFVIIAIGAFVSSCAPDYYVALSKGSGGSHYKNYSKWIEDNSSGVGTIDLHNMSVEDAIRKLEKCNGLILTGGPDVHPGRYGKPGDTARCAIDERRDTLEFALIERAMELNLPILAICRGEQILNVYYGGTLVVDIPEDFGDDVVHRCADSENCFHGVRIEPGSQLSEIVGVSQGTVNTNHHQAVDELADVFAVSAASEDGLIEAYEWLDKDGRPFLIAVQWHPERLDPENPLSKELVEKFVEQVKLYRRTVML